MIKNFVDWYVRKYWSNDYIHVSKISDKIYEARRDELARFQKQLIEELSHLENTKNQEIAIMQASKDAEIRRLELQIEQMNLKKRDLDFLEMDTRRDAKKNVAVAHEIQYCVKRLFDDFSRLMGLIEGAKDKAIEQVKKIDSKITGTAL